MTFRNVLMLSALTGPVAALAQDDPDTFPADPAVDDEAMDDDGQAFSLLTRRGDQDHLSTGMGVALMVGGGVVDRMTTQEASPTDAGGTWLARAVLGTRSFVAAELAYIGSATAIRDATAASDNPMLLSNGGEAALRGQIPVVLGAREQTLVAPFVTAGLGLQVHDLLNAGTDMTNDGQFGDDLTLHLPVGAGLAVASGGFIADARLSYRPTIMNGDQVFGAPSRFDDALDELALTGSVGVEF